MKIKRMFASIISATVISLSSVTICGSNVTYANFSSNLVISRECPAYSSSGMAFSANDNIITLSGIVMVLIILHMTFLPFPKMNVKR